MRHRRSLRRAWAPACAAALLAALLAGGCSQEQASWSWDVFAKPGKVLVPAGSISVYELASRLGLSVKSSTAAGAALGGPGNQVLIYADPGGQVYVNGKAVVQGGIVPVGDVLHVPGGAGRSPALPPGGAA